MESPANFDELRQMTLAYLNRGGPLAGLQGITKDQSGTERGTVLSVDLNGDGVDEVVVSLSLDDAQEQYPWGGYTIYQCTDDQYVEAHKYDFGSYFWAVKVISHTDLVGWGYPQLVIQSDWGGSGCLGFVDVVGWSSTYWAEFLPSNSWGCPFAVDLSQQDQNGRQEIITTGYTPHYAGAGVSRRMRTIFAWIGYKFVERETTLGPADYRIQVLQDAQTALDKGDIPGAIQQYERTATDGTLQDVPSMYEFRTKQDFAHQYQTAFADFRLLALWGKLQEPTHVQTILDRMKAQFPLPRRGSEFLSLAILFQSEVDKGNSLPAACAVVTAHIDMNFPHLAGSDGYIGDWGYANVGYPDRKSICPF